MKDNKQNEKPERDPQKLNRIYVTGTPKKPRSIVINKLKKQKYFLESKNKIWGVSEKVKRKRYKNYVSEITHLIAARDTSDADWKFVWDKDFDTSLLNYPSYTEKTTTKNLEQILTILGLKESDCI